MNELLVTVVCLAYNHGEYIRRTLEGFVNQKTDFKYQVIVHDDASHDNTAEIISEYAEKYPEIIIPIFQTENQYSQKKGIIKTFILPVIQGKYVALCEGDDYWTDVRKLQKQLDALEANMDCFMCVHKVSEVNENEIKTGYIYPSTNMETGVLQSKDFLLKCFRNYSFQTSSYFFRAQEYLECRRNPPEFVKLCDVGDEAYLLYFGQLGNVYYINEEMSCYRRGAESSWSKKNKNITSEKAIKHQDKMYHTIVAFDKYTNYAFHDICLERESKYFARIMILMCQSKEYFKPEYRELFRNLSIKRKLFVFFAVLFPKGAKKIYVNRISKIQRKHEI